MQSNKVGLFRVAEFDRSAAYYININLQFNMLNFSQEIKKCLEDVHNTNNKEQNFQGRLYAHFLPIEKFGYVVEMETSVNDEHLKPILKKRMSIDDSNDFNKTDFKKIEIDLLIYKEDFSEMYAAELKWIYNRTEGWNVVDHLEDFKEDAIFCRQLVEKAHFTETCSVVVYDFDPNKQVKNPRFVKNAEEKWAFLGNDYKEPKYGKIISKEPDGKTDFEWIDLKEYKEGQKYKYYLVKFK